MKRAFEGHMQVTATIRREKDGFVATCLESSVVGEGRTPDEALQTLREGLLEQLRAEAVAPPSGAAEISLDIVLEEPARPSPAPHGPGEARK